MTSNPTLPKVSSSTLTVALVSAAVVLAIRASTRVMQPPAPERPKKNLCDVCDHSEGMHGDRIFGICSYSQYPNMCKCTGFVLWVRPKRKKDAA